MQWNIGKIQGELLFSEASEGQTIEVALTETHGHVLFINGQNLLTEKDASFHQEMMVSPALFLLNQTKMALVLGGGTGVVAQEILRHPSIEKCVVIEKNETLTHACKDFFPKTTTTLMNPRVKLIHEDEVRWSHRAAEENLNVLLGKGYLASDRFDFICIDKTFSFDGALTDSTFFESLSKLSAEKCVIAVHAKSPFDSASFQASLAASLKTQFKNLFFYNYADSTTFGGLSSIAFASHSLHPLDGLKIDRFAGSGLTFQYYNFGVHEGSFLLPEFQKQNLAPWLSNL